MAVMSVIFTYKLTGLLDGADQMSVSSLPLRLVDQAENLSMVPCPILTGHLALTHMRPSNTNDRYQKRVGDDRRNEARWIPGASLRSLLEGRLD